MNPAIDSLAIEFYPIDLAGFAEALRDDFPDALIGESSGYSGCEIVSIVVSASLIFINKLLNFYVKKRDVVSKAVIKIGKDQIEMSGLTSKEIKELLGSKDIEAILNQLRNGNKSNS